MSPKLAAFPKAWMDALCIDGSMTLEDLIDLSGKLDVDGLAYCRECIEDCIEHARAAGVTLVIENHYKDNYWTWPEFAQRMDVFCELVGSIDHPNFGVNYDPSNTILAGEDPIEDLRREENSEGYAARLSHGEIGKGINDYDAIFSRLRAEGFSGWISIEDGVNGFDELERSVAFLRARIGRYW